jgi:hypothetical protein
VFEKNKKLEEQMTPLSTSFLSIKVLSKGTRCMILGLDQVFVLLQLFVLELLIAYVRLVIE